jgi:hypothetical protein
VFSAANGSAVAGATATIAGLAPATAAANGSFQLAGVPASERVVVRVRAPGFTETIVVTAVRQGAVTLSRVTLVPVGTTASIDPAAAVTVADAASPARVDAPANAFARADNGAAPTGALTVSLTAIDPARDPNRMPGDYTTGSGAAVQQIESFGAVAVDIRDAQNNRYDLAGGRTATIRIPVSARDTSPPATIALYYLDETTGRWVEQGSATLAGSGSARYYEGTVGHFSFWNVDRPYDTIYVNGCVQTAGAIRTRNRTVTTDGLDYTGTGRAWSDDNGEFRVPMRRNGQAVLTVQGGTESTVPTVVGPSATDITLPQCLVERGSVSGLAPTILVQPGNVTTAENTFARFAVVADGSTPLSYQWRRNGVDIPGAVGSGYTFFAMAADNGAVFSVVVRNSAGSVTSASATLTVNVPNTAPAILVPPASVSVQVGQVAGFSVTASGTPPLSYQWRRNGTPIAGATTSSYITPVTTLADNGATFDVEVSNTLGSVTSAAATLTVTNTPPVAGTYKRALAGRVAATYGAGCTNASGGAAGPIVVAANGDVSWDGGSMSLSSTSSAVVLSNGYDNGAGVSLTVGAIADSAISRSFGLSSLRSGTLSTSFAEVTNSASGNGRIVRCEPGIAGGIPQPDLVGLVSGWLENTTAVNLPCTVATAGGTSSQMLNVSVAGGQVTLGTRTFALAAARQADAVTALDLPLQQVDSLFAYAATYADNSNVSIGRSLVNTLLTLTYRAADGTSYNCSGQRQP